MPRKAKPSSANPASKSEFIRQRLNLTPKETLAEAKAAGLKLSAAMVYSVRSDANKKGSAPKGKPGPKPKAAAAVSSGRGAGNGLEDVIRNIVRQEIKAFFSER